jgi:acyl dehydratase
MPLNPDEVLALDIPPVTHTYTAKDTILYALGVGLGQDPTDERQLRFVHEDGLQALPSMISVLAHPPFWIRDHAKSVDWVKVVHGEQSFRLHKPVPPSGTLVGKLRVLDIFDKGEGKGALIVSERIVTDAATGEHVATIRHNAFCRGDGGYSGTIRKGPPAHAIPQRTPDLVCDLPTRPESALIYRLSGDYNNLHALPQHARAAGYPRPILHGLATAGVAGHAILRSVCDYDPARLVAMHARFSAPVFPGETIRTEMWRDGQTVSFRARVVGRDIVAIDNGKAELREEVGQ